MAKWFFGEKGQQHGPLTRDELLLKLRSRELASDTLVWTPGQENWRPADQVPDLLNLDKAKTVSERSVPTVAGSRAEWVPRPTGPEISSSAVVSLVLGVFSVSCCLAYVLPVTAVIAVVTGHSGLKTIRSSEGQKVGLGLATSGLILGYICLVASVIFWIFAEISEESLERLDPLEELWELQSPDGETVLPEPEGDLE